MPDHVMIISPGEWHHFFKAHLFDIRQTFDETRPSTARRFSCFVLFYRQGVSMMARRNLSFCLFRYREAGERFRGLPDRSAGTRVGLLRHGKAPPPHRSFRCRGGDGAGRLPFDTDQLLKVLVISGDDTGIGLIGALRRHHVDKFHRHVGIGDLQGIGADVAHPS